ncbi:MAG: ribose-phosphate pyrophosphokinase [Candidatus Pacebacteria bacterium]|nr:ribose-phosphate pyrophosphokinase [Candidatus Paceibacterota bacterium]
MSRTLVHSTAASQYFAEDIARQLGCEMLPTERRVFGDGEKYLRIQSKDRNALMGASSIFVASTNTDDDFLELCRIGSGLAGYGTRRRIFVIPFFGYSTMERAVQPGEIVTAKVNARILSGIPNTSMGNAFLMMDLHVSGLVHYFEGDCFRAEVYAEQVLIKEIEKLGLDMEKCMFGSADLGRPRWIRTFANYFGSKKIALIDKVRAFEETEVEYVIGDVNGKIVIIYDDMARSCKSVINAAKAYLAAGALEVIFVTSHLAFNDEASIDRIIACPFISKVIGTNSHPMSQHHKVKDSRKFVVANASGAFIPCIQDLLR